MWKIIVVISLFTGDVSAARIGSLEFRTKKECALCLAEHGIKVGTGAMLFAQKVHGRRRGGLPEGCVGALIAPLLN